MSPTGTAVANPPAERAAETRAAALRLGVVSYLNAAPLVRGLDADARFELRREVPSRVAERLHAGECDLGMIPSIEYAAGDYAIVPGVGISSRGPVASVLLFLSGPLEQVRRVALDSSSRTSAALTRILLREKLGRDPQYVPMAPALETMLDAADAALLIGDNALDDESGRPRLDLGAEWTALTGLPFVWALWAGPRGRVTGEHVRGLQHALEAGLAQLPQIARERAAGDARREALYASYLRANINYRLGADEIRGLDEYYRRAEAQGFVPWRPEIRFHGDS
ncbi:MAG: menaquinone biosynthetic enzyme MqnA/MqnD family protein [Vicinamibacteria bacterium]